MSGVVGYLSELLDSAQTPDDLAAIEELLAEEEQRQEGGKWIARTLGEVADFFGLAKPTVNAWRTEVPPMPGEPGRYPLNEIVAWRLGKVQASPTAEAKRVAEIEHIKLANEKRRMENDLRRGQLIEREEIERDMSLIWSRLAARLANLPERVSRLLPDSAKSAGAKLVAQEIETARREFADSLEDLA
jgi:phage terminase Nu1 subunit (DNA packaging protein)